MSNIHAPQTRYGVGVIGLGRSGWDIHVQGLLDLSDQFPIIAVSDPVASRRAEAVTNLGCSASEHAVDVINDPRVDLVVVATPSHTHAELGLAALAAGKHVVLEKPMAQTVDEIDQLVEAAEAADRILTCFHNNRFEESLRTVSDLIDSGRLGEVVLVRRTIHRYARRTDWQTLRRFGGGELSNQVSHYLDQVLSIWDEDPVELLAADLRQTISAGDAEDHAKLILRVKDGPLIEIEGSTSVALPQPSWFVVGTAGAISGTRGELTVRWLDPTTLPEIAADDGPAAGRSYDFDEDLDWQEETIQVTPTDRTTAFYENLYAALERKEPIAITPASVRQRIAILQAARTPNN